MIIILTYIGVLVLYKLEKSDHIRSAEVIDCLQPCEHTALRDALKVVLTNVLFLGKSGNKDVNEMQSSLIK